MEKADIYSEPSKAASKHSWREALYVTAKNPEDLYVAEGTEIWERNCPMECPVESRHKINV